MADEIAADATAYKVVINQDEQFSIWPACKENACGWRDFGKQGSKAECLAHIRQMWTDMRPRHLREQMAQQE